jgi:hypothetical protein
MSEDKQLVVHDNKRTPARLKGWRERFIRALRKTPNVKAACATAGVDRRHAYRVRETDEEFAELWKDAIQHSVDKLEEKAFKIALEGDPGLIMFLLRCHKPEVYRDIQQHDIGLLGGIVLIPQKKEGAE